MSAPEKIRLDALHPYPGPSSFDEDHAAFFCGREREAEELFRLVELRPLTVVYGKSGLGKTSLLQAGLFPRMRQAGLVPIRIKLLFGVDERGARQPALADQVRQRIREAIDRDELDGAPPRDGETLWEYFHWTGFWDAAGAPVQAVLVLDQFEEVFTLGHERRRELAALMRELADLVENRIPIALREAGAELPPSYEAVGAKVLIALREEFLAQLDDHRAQMPSLAVGRFRLRPLDGVEAKRAVLDPGREVVTDDIAGRIVKRLANVPDDARLEDIEEVEPALLALYCHELNALRDKARLPKIDVALLTGNERDILEKFYERCMSGMPKEVHLLVEERLLTPDDRRDTIAFGRAIDLGVAPRDLTALVDRRLLRKVPLLGHEYVQIVHDKLVPTIARRRDARQRRDEREKATRRLARRLGTAGLGALAIAGTAALGYSWASAAAALRARELEEARATISNAEQQAAEAAKAGWRAAGDQRWDDVARELGAAYDALAEARARRAKFPRDILDVPDPPPDLALLATRFEATAGRLEALLVDRGGIDRFVLSKDGTRGAALGADGRTVTLVDIASRRSWFADAPGAPGSFDDKGPIVEQTAVFSGTVRDLVISGDGGTLFGLGDKGQVVVWRVADGTRLTGFRVRLARPSFQVDRSGSRVLARDLDADRAIAVTIDAGPSRALSSVELVTARSSPVRTGARRWDRSSDWRDFTLSADGHRVIGLREESSRRAGQPHTSTEIVLWALPDAVAVAHGTIEGRVESAVASENGKLLAARTEDRRVRVLSFDDRSLTHKVTLPADAWFAFDDPFPALIVAGEKSLTVWDLEAEPNVALDLPTHARARKAALSRDRAQALVAFEDDVRLYDTKLGQPRAIAPIPEAERASMDLRVPGGAFIVTAKSDAVRVRSLGGADPRPSDGILWGESSAAKAAFAASIPRVGAVEDADGDGEQIAVLADGAVSVLRAWPRDAPPDRFDITPLAGREPAVGKSLAVSAPSQVESVRAIALRAGHVAALDASGALRISAAPFSSQRRAPAETGAGGLLSIARDGSWIVSGGPKSAIRVWDADSGRALLSADARDLRGKGAPEDDKIAVTAIAIASDDDRPRAIVGDEKGGLRALRSGADKVAEWTTEPFRPTTHTAAVRAIAVASDGRAATGGDDGRVALWDREGKLIYSIAIDAVGRVRALRFADEGRLLIGAVNDGVRVWKADNGSQSCAVPHAEVVREIAIEGDGPLARAASVDASGAAIVWSIASCGVLRRMRGIAYAGFLAALRDRVITVRRTGRVELWPASNEATREGRGEGPRGASTWGAPQGAGLLSGDEESAIFRWRPDGSSAAPTRLAVEIGAVVAVARGGDRVLAATDEGVLRVFFDDPSRAPITARIPLDPGLNLRALTLADAGRALVTLEDGPDDRPRARVSSVSATSVVPGTPTALAGGDGCLASRSSPSGRFFAASDTQVGPRALVVEASGCVRVWDAEGTLLVEGSGPDTTSVLSRISAAAIEPTFAHIALAAADGTVSTWALEAGASTARLRRIAVERRRHTSRVRALAFHPAGRFFVSAGDDGQVWLWDAQDGHALTRLGAHPSAISWAQFKPDGSEVVTGGAGGWIRSFATRTQTDDPVRVLRAVDAWLPELRRRP